MKNPNVCQSPISRDTLIIKDAETGVKRSVPKLLFECSMRQLHNELIAPPDQGGLLGARHHESNDVIISDTMLRLLVPPELRPMTDHHKIMCGCTICNTAKYLQTSLNAWRRKHMKHMEAQANASRSRSKAMLLDAYTTYADFVFPNNEALHPRCENAADSVLCAPTTECSLPNWKCVVRHCPSCTSIAIPAVELDTSSTAPMIMFHTYMTQFSCSHHGVLILDKVTYYLDANGKKKKTCWFCEQLIQAKTPDFERGRLYEKIETLAYHQSYYKILGKLHVADDRQKAFASTPGDISTRSDYAEQFGFAPDGQLQSEYYDNNQTLSMEGCCLDHFLPTENVMNCITNGSEYLPSPEDTNRNAATTTCHFTLLLELPFDHDRMKRHGTMWDQTDGCGKQYRCCIAYYLLSVVSVKFQIVIDRAVDTPGHGKDVVDGFNAVQKRFLTTCLRKTNMPEVHDTVNDDDRMLIHSMTEKGEVSFADECMRLLLHRDRVGTTGDKKHAKREVKARIKSTFYHVHDDEDLLYNGIKATYKIVDNRDKDTTTKEEMQEMHETVLMGMTQTSDKETLGYYIVQWTGIPYTLQEQYECNAFNPPVLIPTGELVCEAKFWTPMSKCTHWYHEPDEDLFVMVKVKQVVMTNIDMKAVNATNTLLRKWAGYMDKNPHCLGPDDQA
eukprot:scaffold21956_cov70-Attheya_sp.AAC.2